MLFPLPWHGGRVRFPFLESYSKIRKVWRKTRRIIKGRELLCRRDDKPTRTLNAIKEKTEEWCDRCIES